ncbi:hypothetical protein H6G54_02700 [Anabaena cylindrica FACHB-243]|nr:MULTISPECIES: hypothetical protein [Anabaena]MBD2416636.1 hypothetical protein [Anabaena cylindrica FACHB-243]MBY5284501.1 hypothetical protein [Anabaena sp. CCAP 1446/1C]MBY5306751.1 hypothetical protein [Anabaena sp. CCAP 1446/1C]MCM2410088.1 hypothetical protein [Anabaena sp. CCAP 1446/1C]
MRAGRKTDQEFKPTQLKDNTMNQEILEKLAEVIDQLREILEALEESPDIKSHHLLDNAFGNCEEVYNEYNV